MLSFLFFSFFWGEGLSLAPAVLDLTSKTRFTLISQRSTWLCLLIGGVKGECHHFWLMLYSLFIHQICSDYLLHVRLCFVSFTCFTSLCLYFSQWDAAITVLMFIWGNPDSEMFNHLLKSNKILISRTRLQYIDSLFRNQNVDLSSLHSLDDWLIHLLSNFYVPSIMLRSEIVYEPVYFSFQTQSKVVSMWNLIRDMHELWKSQDHISIN